MKVYVELTKDRDLIKSIITDPVLWHHMAEDGSKREDWEPNFSFQTFLKAEYNGILVGIMMIYGVNNVTLSTHIYIDPIYWGTKIGYHSAMAGIRWTEQNSKFTKLVTQIPETLTPILNFTKSIGFNEEGYSPNSLLSKGKLVGQYHYGREINNKQER